MGEAVTIPEGKKEAVKTYVEQTKLLVTLASAFLVAPPGLVTLLKDKPAIGYNALGYTLVGIEALFIVSVLSGYVTLASVAGSQDDESFDVYRPATRCASLIQFFSYLFGMIGFIFFAIKLLSR